MKENTVKVSTHNYLHNDVAVKIGIKLHDLRKASHLSQETLAERVGSSLKVISKYESGSTIPGLKRMFQLSKELNFSLDEFLSDVFS